MKAFARKDLVAGALALACTAAVVLATRLQAAEIKGDIIMRLEKALPETASVKPEKPRKVLVYTRASGFVPAFQLTFVLTVRAAGRSLRTV